MPLLSFERANQWVPLDFMLKTDKMKLPLHEFSFVKATAPFMGMTKIFRLLLWIRVFNNWRNLGEHVVNVFKHCAFCRAKAACAFDMFDNFLILKFNLIKKLAERLHFLLGIFNYI